MRRTQRRPVALRTPLPVIILAFDDRKTAVRYFDVLRQEHRQSLTLHLVAAPKHGAGPREVVHAAIDAQRRLGAPPDEQSERTSTWVLIDLEAGDARAQEIERVRSLADQHGVQIARSRPCFEVWTLLHLSDSIGSHPDCRSVVAELERSWEREFERSLGKKAQMDVRKLIPRVMSATERARRGHQIGAPTHTEVYRVIEEMLRWTTR
jgi:hypothetical protein